MQRVDPRTYEAFRMMIDEVEDLFLRLNPVEAIVVGPIAVITPLTPTGFIYQLLKTSIQLNWDQAVGAHMYEVRQGTVWDTAIFRLRMVSLSANLLPMKVGTYTFLLKSISATGAYSDIPASLTLTILGPMGVTPTSSVIDNNVLLRWEESASAFMIDYYIVDRGGVEVGKIYGTFASIFEGLAGSFTYGVTPVDIASNVGPRNTVTATVNAPSDFVLEAAYVSDLNGTKVRVYKTPEVKLLACTDVETWEEHFTENAWNTIQDQVNAGYPLYAQPLELDGYYEETHDFGVILEASVISLSWSQEQVAAFVNSQAELSHSTDGVNFSPVVFGSTTFADLVRYVKFRLKFDTIDRRMVAYFYNITIALSVKRDLDSGRVNVFAADTGGTQVLFNKPFKDVESITLTAEGLIEQTAIYDFVDVPNPLGFKILLFNIAGVRVNGTVSWKARGIL